MKKTIATLLILSLILTAGCSGQTPSGDAPSIMERSQAIAVPPESPVSKPEPDATSAPDSNSLPESSSAASVSAAPTPAPTPKPTPKPTPTPTSESTGNPELQLSSNTVKAGNFLVLTCKNPPPLEELAIKNSLSGSSHFFMNGDEAVALVGISRNAALGQQQLTVTGLATDAVLPYTVVDAGFESESFQMAESVQNSTVNSSAARDEYNRITGNVMAVDTAEPNFPNLDGFVMPVNPPTFKISSSYGFTRIVNGKVSGRHEGVDFPAPKGTPVVAAGDGKVLYAGLMQMTGNTVIIEHGAGLKSWYHHMDSLSCKTGDVLQAGDPVGKVGTTGYSTGNHLHFGMSINDTYTNPWQFIPKP
ncbi:MAG: M23 family metallopeptidase [Angelakisella sp.]